MTISVTDLNELTDTEILSHLRVYQQRLSEAKPSLDVRRGPIHDLVLVPHAIIEAARHRTIQRYLSARSLRDVMADPTLADEGVVDGNLSNWGVSRNPGSKATGQVVIVLSKAINVTISRGALFSAGGLTFIAVSAFASKTSDSLVNTETDRILTPIGENQFAFLVDVVAANAGEEYSIRKDTLVEPQSKPTAFLMAYASSDFVEGQNVETNDSLLARLADGAASQTTSNRASMRSLLSHSPNFSRVTRSSIVGLGDTEMVRDRHGLMPVSQGGRADWYIRTQPMLAHTASVRTATLVEVLDNGQGIWQFTTLRSEFPGMYEIRSITPHGVQAAGSLTVTADQRGFNVENFDHPPVIETAEEAAFSPFQTAVIRFVDPTKTVTETDLLTTAQYDVEVVSMPQLADIQNFISNRDVAHYGGDVLVKAPVPCFVSITFDVHQRATDKPLDVDKIREEIAAAINSVGFTGHLYASQLTGVVGQHLPDGAGVGAIDMLGRLRYPNGIVRRLRNTVSLDVPNDPDAMVTARTVQFFADPRDVFVNVKNSLPVQA